MYSDARFENCLFQSNGALYRVMADCVSGTPVFTQCTFLHNNTLVMYLDFSNAKFTNCLFHGNVGTGNPTGSYATIEIHGGMPTISDCTITGNTAAAGTAAILLVSDSEPRASIQNTIFWGDTPQEILCTPGAPNYSQVTYSDVAGGYSGAGNIYGNPLFANPGAHDFDLAPGSPCIDAADNTVVPSDVVVDLLNRPRFVNDPVTPDHGVGPPPIVDMGAYEFQAVIRLGDMDCSSAVNVSDIAPFVLALTDPDEYAQQYPSCDLLLGDLNQDGIVDGLDIPPFVEQLLARNDN
jgi:hypothetical protein